MRIGRAPSDDLSQVSLWSAPDNHPGIAHGWHGVAWLWLTLVRAGLAPERRRTLLAIRERIRGSEHPGDGTSLFVGSAARPVVAALASRVDPAGRELAERAVAEWVAARVRRPLQDVMFGDAGALLAAAEIAGHLPDQVPARFAAALHERCRRDLTRRLAHAATTPVQLGLAHGLVGLLLAVEAGRRAFGLALTTGLRRRTLAALEHSAFRVRGHDGLFWPIRTQSQTVDAHGWCHGAPGIGLALGACYALSGWRGYRSMAHSALAGAASPVTDIPSICCGVLGQVQVLVEAARLFGDDAWLDRAHRLARRLRPRCAADPRRARGLWKGRVGYSFVAWRLAAPEWVPFPGLGPLSADARRTIR
jgi:lanthionine synthetase-like protein